MITIPTWITLSRLAVIPVLLYGVVHTHWFLAFIVFGFAVATDFLDGYLARVLQQVSVLGQLLDPLVDKVLICSTLWTIAYRVPQAGLPQIVVQLITLKELLLVAVGIIIYSKFGAPVVRPNMVGKLAMAMQSGLLLWIIGQQLYSSVATRWTPLFAYSTLAVVGASLIFYAWELGRCLYNGSMSL